MPEAPPFSPPQLVVTVEHASNRVPRALDSLGLPQKWFDGHHGFDPGAARVGRMLARAFGAPLHLGRWSRLVADLNRSAHHPRVVPPCFSHGGRVIPGNQLTSAERQARIRKYWLPWRSAVEANLDEVVAAHGVVLHVSVHSFVERLGGEERRNHVGLLYGPSRRRERTLADRLDARLTASGLRVRRNYPYSGLEDGFCMRMRAERPASRYVGMEIELNQRQARRPKGAERLGAALAGALAPELGP